MQLPKFRPATIALGAIALCLLLLSVYLVVVKTDPHVERHETQYKTLVFDYQNSESETKSLDLSLALSPEQLRGAKELRVFVHLKVSEIDRYPDSASGFFQCQTRILINDKEWVKTNVETMITSRRSEEWGSEKDEAQEQYFQSTYPDYVVDTDAVDLLDTSGMNVIRAITTCTSRVTTTGPTLAIVTFGPLVALIST